VLATKKIASVMWNEYLSLLGVFLNVNVKAKIIVSKKAKPISP
jgi:hypothetical protein